MWRYLQNLLDSGHAELQRAVVHEPEDVAEPSGRQPLHVDLVLVPLPHVCCEHDPEVVALGGQKRLVGLPQDEHTSTTVQLSTADGQVAAPLLHQRVTLMSADVPGSGVPLSAV